jgi:hypothetical protein
MHWTNGAHVESGRQSLVAALVVHADEEPFADSFNKQAPHGEDCVSVMGFAHSPVHSDRQGELAAQPHSMSS